MCGIAGIVAPHALADDERLDRMVGALSRRGPDSEGVHQWSRAAFGHRRLAIFDLSPAGHQPMLTADGRVGVVFNGAIYNFKPLRDALEAEGATFRSRTDTEVLLWGYRIWGVDRMVQRLRGMFAFALWDEDRATLWLVRDRLGVKPLLYTSQEGVIAFASTARALRAGGWVQSIDPRAVADFLEYGYITEEHAVYASAHKVPAATIVEVRDGRIAMRRYWDPPAPGSHRVGFEEALEETERLLLAATERRLQADVPVGALLSGGVDSALVCWAITHLGGDVTAFTVGTPGHEADETLDAAETARELGIRHQVLRLPPQDDVDVETLAAAYGEPFACSSALGMLTVAQAVARADVKVLLTGDGGDDVFLGYDRHRMMRRISRTARWLPPFVTPLWRAARHLLPDDGALRRGKHLVDYLTGGLGAFLSAADGLPGYAARQLLGPRLRGLTVASRRLPWSVRSARHLLEEYLAHDLRHQFVAEYLTKVDGATMHYALEARSPFLDQELWEFAASLPVDLRLHGGALKALLRALAARRISRRVATGAKRGFTIPVHAWIQGIGRERVGAVLRDSPAVQEGWLDTRGLERELEQAMASPRAAERLWYAYVLDAWLRHERVESPAATLA